MRALIQFRDDDSGSQLAQKQAIYMEHRHTIERADGSKEETVRYSEKLKEGMWRGSRYFDPNDNSDKNQDHRFETKGHELSKETRITDDGKGNRITDIKIARKEDTTSAQGTKLIKHNSLGLKDDRQAYLTNFSKGTNPFSLLSNSEQRLITE